MPSLEEKFKAIQDQVKAEEHLEVMKEGKKVFSDISNEKQTISNKINDLNVLLSELKMAYSLGNSSLESFKSSKVKIQDLFNKYSTSLKTKGINSVEDILNNEDYKEVKEITEYHQKGASQIIDKNKKGELGERVENINIAKEKIKEALPEMELNFSGKPKGKETSSHREESLLKIQKYIQDLEQQQLAEIQKKEALAKSEYLPKIKDIVTKNLEKIFPEGKGYSIQPLAANLDFISDEVFELCGDELWPEAKVIALNLILEKNKEKKINYQPEEIGISLEAEKLIFDVKKIREQHDSLLKIDHDRTYFPRLTRSIQDGFSRILPSELIIKDNKVYPYELLKQAEYFKEKNPEAKEVCEEAINNTLNILREAQSKINPGWLSRKQTKEDMADAKKNIEKSISEMIKIEAPDNFYTTKNIYEFSNKFSSASSPNFKGYQSDWCVSLKTKLKEDLKMELDKVMKLINDEHDRLYKFGNDAYAFRDCKKVMEGGLEIPVVNLEDDYICNSLNDKEALNSFIKSIQEKVLSIEELSEKIKQKVAVFYNKISNYHNSEEILAKVKKLKEKFSNFNEFRGKGDLINIKMQVKNNQYKGGLVTHIEDYNIQDILFYK